MVFCWWKDLALSPDASTSWTARLPTTLDVASGASRGAHLRSAGGNIFHCIRVGGQSESALSDTESISGHTWGYAGNDVNSPAYSLIVSSKNLKSELRNWPLTPMRLNRSLRNLAMSQTGFTSYLAFPTSSWWFPMVCLNTLILRLTWEGLLQVIGLAQTFQKRGSVEECHRGFVELTQLSPTLTFPKKK